MQEQHLYILGHPIGHSKSPAMYNAVYEAAGLPWHYGSMDLPEEQRARAFVQKADFLSINVTTPYKPLALACAQESDMNARLAQGANLLVNEGGSDSPYLRAYNVDGAGCVAYLKREGVRFERARVVVCGTGPTALSIMSSSLSAGADVMLLGRDARKAKKAIGEYEAIVAREGARPASGDGAPGASGRGALGACSYLEGAAAIAGADVIIDATSLGMHEGDPAPFDVSLIGPGQVVLDTVYGHGMTALIAAARKAGATAFDGRGMLVGQAVETLGIVVAAAGAACHLSHDEAFSLMSRAAGFDL